MPRFQRLTPLLAGLALLASALPAGAAEQGAVLSATFTDDDRNARIDRALLSLANPDGLIWTTDGLSAIAVTFDGTEIAKTRVYFDSAPDANPVRAVFVLDEAVLPRDTSVSAFALAGPGTEGTELIDAARPILLSSAPVPGALEVRGEAAIVLTFSEPMAANSLDYASAPNPGSWSVSWSADGRTASLQHLPYQRKARPTFTFIAGSDLAGNAVAAGHHPDVIRFTVTDSSFPATVAPESVFQLTHPEEVTSFPVGERTFLTWWSNLSDVTTVRLQYARGTSSEWTTIVTLPVSADPYPWYPPAALQGAVRVRVEGLGAQGAVVASHTAAGINLTAGDPEAPRVLAGPTADASVDGTAFVRVTLDRPVPSLDLVCENGPTQTHVTLSGDGPYDLSATITGLAPGTHACAFVGSDLFGAAIEIAVPAFSVSVSDDGAELEAIADGDLVKSDAHPAVYRYQDGKRWVFPTETVFFSWHANFDGVVTIPQAQLSSIPLGGNVTMRPGSWMVKIQSDPKTYAVEPGGVLRWVRTESQAAALFGPQWNAHIRDIDVGFFVDYGEGAPLADGEFPEGYLAATSDGRVWLVDGVARHEVTASGLEANGYRRALAANVDTSGQAWTALAVGAPIDGKDARLGFRP